MKLNIDFIEISDNSQYYYNYLENYIKTCNFLPLDFSIVGKEFVRNKNGKEVVEDIEIKYFKLIDMFHYKEVILEKVKTDEKQTRLW
jgi:hypothetical protein